MTDVFKTLAVVVTANTTSLEGAMAKAATSIGAVRTEMTGLNATGAGLGSSFDASGLKIQKAALSLDQAKLSAQLAEQRLSALKTAAANAGTEMDAGLAAKVKKADLAFQSSNLRVQQAELNLKSLESQAASAGAVAGSTGTLLKAGIGAGALAVAGALYESVKAAASFQAQMTKLNTQANAGLDAQQFKSVENQVLDLSGALGFSPTSLAESLYHVYSAGFSGAAGLDIMTESAKLAKIGGSELEITTQAVIGSMAAFASQGLTASQAAGLLNETVGLGDLKMQGLAQAISTGVLPVFATAGLGLKDFSAALATMTDNVTPPEVAATRLRQAISQMAAPTTTAIKSLNGLGIGATELATDLRKPDGLEVAVGDLKKHYDDLAAKDGPVAAFNDLMHAFGGARSGSYVAELVDEFGRLQSKYQAINSEDPAVKLQQSWAQTQATVSQKTQQIEASFQSVAIRIGTDVLPQVANLEDGFIHLGNDKELISFLQGLVPQLREVGGGLEDIARFGIDVARDVAPSFALLGGATVKAAAELIGLVARGVGDLATGADKARIVIEPLVVLIGARYAAGILGSAAANGLFAVSATAATAATKLYSAEMVQSGLVAQAYAAKLETAAIAADGVGTSLGRLGIAVGIGVGIAAAAGHIAEALDGTKQKADAFAKSIEAPYDLKSQQGLQQALLATENSLNAVNKTVEQSRQGAGGFAGLALDFDKYIGILSPAEQKQKDLQTQLKNLQSQVSSTVQATQDDTAAMGALSTATQLTTGATQDLQQQTSALQTSMTNIGGLAAAGTDAINALTAQNKAAAKQSTADQKESLKEQRNAIEDTYTTAKNAAESSKNDVTNSSKGSKSAIQDYINTLSAKKQADLQDLATTQSTSAGSAQAVQDSSGKAILSLNAWITQLRTNQAAMQNWETNLQTIAQKSGDPGEALDLAKLDPKTYGTAINQLAHDNADQFTKDNAVIQQSIESTSLDNANTLLDGLKVMAEVGKEGATATASSVAQALGDGTKAGILYVQGIMDGYQGVVANAVNPVLTGLGQPSITVNNGSANPYGTLGQDVVTPKAPTSLGQPISVPIHPKAQGGFERGTPAIAPGGANVLWAEPETGGEAYIPLASSKRQRSIAIWQKTGELLGLSGGSNKAFADGGVTLPQPPTLSGYVIANTSQDAMQAMYAAATAFLNSSSSQSSNYGGPAQGAPQGQVVDWIHQAEAIAKWPDSYTNGIYELVQHESGGNPKAINLSPSDYNFAHYGAAGASRGLTQTIPGTFNAYAFPGHSDIFNPVDNILAGISYALKNYGPSMVIAGGRHNAAGNYIGYGNGGINFGVYDSGGSLMPGTTIAYNNTGRPETVMTSNDIDRIISAINQSGKGGNQIYVQAPSPVDAGREVRRALA